MRQPAMDELPAPLTSWISERKAGVARVVFLFPIALTLAFLAMKVGWGERYVRITQEDSPVENLQFLAYLCASILALCAGIGRGKRGGSRDGYVLFLLSALLMFAALEEISWGQRYFGVATPEWFKHHSFQQELTIHNLKPLQRKIHYLYLLAGLLLSFGWIAARYLTSRTLLRDDLKASMLLFTPGWYLMPYFLPTVLVYGYFCTYTLMVRISGWDGFKVGNFVIWRDQEPAELLLSLGCVLLVMAVTLKPEGAPH